MAALFSSLLTCEKEIELKRLDKCQISLINPLIVIEILWPVMDWITTKESPSTIISWKPTREASNKGSRQARHSSTKWSRMSFTILQFQTKVEPLKSLAIIPKAPLFYFLRTAVSKFILKIEVGGGIHRIWVGLLTLERLWSLIS